MSSTYKHILLHAPNIHTGGGLTLLESILTLKKSSIYWVQLDERIKSKNIFEHIPVKRFVKHSIIGRLYAEWVLYITCKKEDTAIIFNSLPPIFPLKGKTKVFIQNRLIITKFPLTDFSWKIKLRITIERIWAYCLQSNVDEYIVQTPSMKKDLQAWIKKDIPITVTAFMPIKKNESINLLQKKIYDFVYVASGDVHKNHLTLIDAWILLQESNISPSLALTLDNKNDKKLLSRIIPIIKKHHLNIHIVGQLSHSDIDSLYIRSKALIYPSTSESFGLPLLEAAQHKLPIIASERDYVRDIIIPQETFDPLSSLSIARAILRFLSIQQPPVQLQSVKDFLHKESS